MSTKQHSSSKELEDDLNREVEQDDVDADVNADELATEGKINLDESGDRRSSSESRQSESTNIHTSNSKKSRARPNLGKPKILAKRRKTNESETSDLSVSGDDVATTNPGEPIIKEPVPGPSGFHRDSKDADTYKSNRMKKVDEEEDTSSEESERPLSSKPISGLPSIEADEDEEAIHPLRETRTMHEQSVGKVNTKSTGVRFQEKASVSGAESHEHTAAIKAIRDQHIASFRSSALEEIYRMPIYESDSRRTLYGGNSYNTEDEGRAHGREEAPPRVTNAQSAAAPRESDFEQPSDEKSTANTAQEKQRMLWARRVFFMSTELIFPGFTRYTDAQEKRKHYMAVRVRSSWVLQALLYADILYFIMWLLAFLSTCDIAVAVLKELHGNLIICMTALFTLVNIPRLIFGLKGNENDKIEILALFWMMTFIVQAPLFGFILFTDIFTPTRLAFTLTMDGIMMIFIFLEVIVGTIHLKNLIRDELKVIELAKKCGSLSQPAVGGPSNLHPRVVNTAHGPVVNWTEVSAESANQEDSKRNKPAEENDEDWSTDESDDEFDWINTKNRLINASQLGRHVDEVDEPERDDSNQVSSTSDSIRQRPIRVI